MKAVRRLTFRRLILPFVVMFAVSLCGLIILYLRSDCETRAELEFEAAKTMLTVIAGVLIGNILLVIVRDYEERRRKLLERREARRNRRQMRRQLLRTDLLEGVLNLYSQTKGLRRRLRAQIASDNHIQGDKYSEFLGEISDVQLGLERYTLQAETGVSNGVVPELVPRELESMERYLGGLVKEYEELRQQSLERLLMADLPRLHDFVGPFYQSEFYSDFVVPFRHVMTEVAKEVDK